jgi:hypothetical protein
MVTANSAEFVSRDNASVVQAYWGWQFCPVTATLTACWSLTHILTEDTVAVADNWQSGKITNWGEGW